VDEPLKEGGGPRQNKGKKIQICLLANGRPGGREEFLERFLFIFYWVYFFHSVSAAPARTTPGKKVSLFNALGVPKIPPSLYPPMDHLQIARPNIYDYCRLNLDVVSKQDP
jgi:hypothetical protein